MWWQVRTLAGLVFLACQALGLAAGHAQSRFAAQNMGVLGQAPPACVNWDMAENQTPGFEKLFIDYLELARASDVRDESCLSRTSWFALHTLFDPSREGEYDTRMTFVASEFERAEKKGDLRVVRAIEEFTYLAQHQWLTVMYERLAAYNSRRSTYVSVGAVGAAFSLVGATMLAHGPLIRKFNAESKSLMFKVLRYVGRNAAHKLFVGRAAGVAFGVSGGVAHVRVRPDEPVTPPKAPLDYVSTEGGLYDNYTDLAFYRDLAGLAASSVAGYASATTVELYFLKSVQVLLGASRVAAVAGHAHVASAVVSFIVGMAVERATEEAVTRVYHARYKKAVAEDRAMLIKGFRDDWALFVAASDLTASLIQWLSTQETPIVAATLEEVAAFRRTQICSRLMLKPISASALPYWERFDVNDKEWMAIPVRGEARVRKNVAKVVERHASRLANIRAAVLATRDDFVKLDKPYLKVFSAQLTALLERLDSLTKGSEWMELEIEYVKADLEMFEPGSLKWRDLDFLREISGNLSCRHPDQDQTFRPYPFTSGAVSAASSSAR